MIQGILMDMSDLNLQRPASSDIQRAIAEYERKLLKELGQFSLKVV